MESHMAGTTMNSKQRVHAALRRQPTDRVPIFLTFYSDTLVRLARDLEVPRHCVEAVLGNDVRMAWVNNDYAMEGMTHDKDGEGHVDLWGIHWAKDGLANRIVNHPLDKTSAGEVRKYCFPLQHVEELLSRMNPLVAGAYEDFIGCDVSPCVFDMYVRLRGMDQAMADLAAEPALVDEMLDRCAAFAALLAELACRRFPLDWLWTGDEVAGRDGLLMSPECWRRLVKPHLALVFEVAKRHRLWVVYHCRGSVRSIIPDLIEMGLDVLHPVPCDCKGMDPLELKREFGDRLALAGGLDADRVLCHGSVDDVRRATRKLLDGMAACRGGYILATSHPVLPGTPVENLFAMLAEAGLTREEICDRAAEVRAKYRQKR
jgi:uroporphyrinogen decarboxylase